MAINNQLAKFIASNAGVSTTLNTAKVLFSSAGQDNDWRVKLSLPSHEMFQKSPVLLPLKATRGIVFPFTPSITIGNSATYTDMSVVHQNFQFSAYNNSKINEITITGDFIVEDTVQAQYWVAVLHYLRSVTKMFSGDADAGNPPPIVNLNGYGDYVFNNVPVVIKSFEVTLPQDVDYFETSVGNNLGEISVGLDTAADIGDLIGSSSAIRKAGTVINTASGIASKVNRIFDKTGTSSGLTYVPVKSSITVTVSPVYSKSEVRNFSLHKFVNGEYAKTGKGFI